MYGNQQTQVLTRTMPSSWNPPLYLTPVMRICNSSSHVSHSRSQEYRSINKIPCSPTLLKTEHIPFSNRWSILISQDTCRQKMLSNWPWPTAQFISWGWIRLASICKENYISHAGLSVIACVYCPFCLYFDTSSSVYLYFDRWTFSTEKCFTNFHLFCRESSRALSTTPGLWTCDEGLSTLKNLSLTSTESFRAELRNKFNITIHFHYTRWNVYNQMTTKNTMPSYVSDVPKCNFHSEIYLSNLLCDLGSLGKAQWHRLVACSTQACSSQIRYMSNSTKITRMLRRQCCLACR